MQHCMFHLFQSFGQIQSLELQNQLKMAMAGLKWSIAVEKQRGDGWIETGIEPMLLGLYKALCKWFTVMDSSKEVFGCLFLVLSWKLANTCLIQLKHF